MFAHTLLGFVVWKRFGALKARETVERLQELGTSGAPGYLGGSTQVLSGRFCFFPEERDMRDSKLVLFMES
jgi:hypothetical protein